MFVIGALVGFAIGGALGAAGAILLMKYRPVPLFERHPMLLDIRGVKYSPGDVLVIQTKWPMSMPAYRSLYDHVQEIFGRRGAVDVPVLILDMGMEIDISEDRGGRVSQETHIVH